MAIQFAAGQITLTAGPVTCNYKKKDLDENIDVNFDAFILCNVSHCDILGSGAVITEDILTIQKAGTFIIQGTFDGQLIIDVDKEDFVHLILNGITINSFNGPAIYAVMANKVTITLNGNNKLTDSTTYTLDSEGEPDACLFVDADLSINGSGSLGITANFGDAIRCKKDLKIISGNIIIPKAKLRGLKARNSICIKDGVIDIISDDTAIKVTKDTDPEKGFIVIDGGKINIVSKNKGIHAETHLTINDGYIDIKKSTEGLEGQMIDILGGEIHISATDDGINGSKIAVVAQNGRKYSYSGTDGSVYINIVGGKTYITVPGGDVDCIDANGVLYIGGTAEVYGSIGYGSIYGNMSVLDADGSNAICANATVIATSGYGGRYRRDLQKRQFAPPPGRETHGIYQPYIQGSISSQKAGTKFTVYDMDENVIATYTPPTAFASFIVTSPKMIVGGDYIVSAGGKRQVFVANAPDSGTVQKIPSVTSKPEVTTTTTTTTTTSTSTSIFFPSPKEVTTTVTTTTTAFTNSTATISSTVTNITTEIVDTTKDVAPSTSLKTIPPTTISTKTVDDTIITEVSTPTDSTSIIIPTIDVPPNLTSTSIVEPTNVSTITETSVIEDSTETIKDPTETTTIAEIPTSGSGNLCSSAILKQGYKCCAPDCRVAYSDPSGDWGYEQGEWCGCGNREPTLSKCSQAIIDNGYSCCSESCRVTHVDQYGEWGYENNEWCGCSFVDEPGICSSAITDKGYKCCSKNHCRVKFEDEDGKWSFEEDWCGVPLDCFM